MLGIAIYRHADLSSAFSGASAYMAALTPVSAGSPYAFRNIRFTTGIQNGVGGDVQLSMVVDLPATQELLFGKGDLVFLYVDGAAEPTWAGRVSTTGRKWVKDTIGSIEVTAVGLWAAFGEKLTPETISANEEPNVTESVAYAMRELGTDSPVSFDMSDMVVLSTALGGGAWTFTQYQKYLSDVVRSFSQYGNDDTPPLPLLFRVMGWKQTGIAQWLNAQYDVDLEPPGMGSDVAGAGAITYGVLASNASLEYATAAADAAMIYDATMYQKDTYYRDARVRHDIHTWRMADGVNKSCIHFSMITKATAPACETAAAFDARVICRIWQGTGNALTCEYRTDAGAQYTWDLGTSMWRAGVFAAYNPGVNQEYRICYEHDEVGFRLSAWDSTGVTLYFETDVVPWATWATKDTDALWAVVGCPYTDQWNTKMRVREWKIWRWDAGAKCELKAIDDDDWEYEIDVSVLDNYSTNDPDESLANGVAASYGDPIGYTAMSVDTDSEALYGRRELLVDAGPASTGTAALRLRDRKLEESKDPTWRGSPFNVRGMIKRKGGALVPAANIRAGERIRVNSVLFPNGLTTVVGSTSYDAESDTVAVTPVNLPDSVSLWITQLSLKATEV